jgi:hypothetical protein
LLLTDSEWASESGGTDMVSPLSPFYIIEEDVECVAEDCKCLVLSLKMMDFKRQYNVTLGFTRGRVLIMTVTAMKTHHWLPTSYYTEDIVFVAASSFPRRHRRADNDVNSDGFTDDTEEDYDEEDSDVDDDDDDAGSDEGAEEHKGASTGSGSGSSFTASDVLSLSPQSA